jgi:hypothetical protein
LALLRRMTTHQGSQGNVRLVKRRIRMPRKGKDGRKRIALKVGAMVRVKTKEELGGRPSYWNAKGSVGVWGCHLCEE